jgi:hypothetical protein
MGPCRIVRQLADEAQEFQIERRVFVVFYISSPLAGED